MRVAFPSSVANIHDNKSVIQSGTTQGVRQSYLNSAASLSPSRCALQARASSENAVRATDTVRTLGNTAPAGHEEGSSPSEKLGFGFICDSNFDVLCLSKGEKKKKKTL